MTFSYNIGLTGGSVVAYLLDAILGEKIPNPCGGTIQTDALLTSKNSSSYTLGISPATSTLDTTTAFSTVTKTTEYLSSPIIPLLNSTLPVLINSTLNSTIA